MRLGRQHNESDTPHTSVDVGMSYNCKVVQQVFNMMALPFGLGAPLYSGRQFATLFGDCPGPAT